MENGTVSREKDKPVLDEQTLAKLLEAAYVALMADSYFLASS